VSNIGSAWVHPFPAAGTDPLGHEVAILLQLLPSASRLPMMQHHGQDLQCKAAPMGCE